MLWVIHTSSFAFGFIHITKQPEAVATVLHNDVVPFYKSKGLTVKALLTEIMVVNSVGKILILMKYI